MTVREFKLVNENGQAFSLMDIKNYVLLTEPSGLGYAYDNSYEQIGNTFIESVKKLSQGQIGGTVNALSYDNIKALGDFIEKAKTLKLYYTIPYENGDKTYIREVSLQSLEKTEKQPNGILSQPIILDCLSLWYSEDVTVYSSTEEGEMRWNFRWDARYVEYDVRNLTYNNQGHTEAPIYVEITGAVTNPQIEIIQNGESVGKIKIPITLSAGEKLLYSSKTGDLFIQKKATNGTITNLFNENYVDITKDNILRLPLGASEIVLSADNDITSASVTIYPQFKIV